MTHAAIFDVDGTLTNTTGVDAECYVAAIESVFGFKNVSGDWNDYNDVTDSGILFELVQTFLGRLPTTSELQEFVAEFLSLLRDAHTNDSDQFSPIPGADTFIKRLRESGWRLAIATGGWGATARAKLQFAGIDISGLPLVAADDARSRVTILEMAISQLGLSKTSLQPPVVFGDAIWDADAANTLGIPMVGVGTGSRARGLLDAGAVSIIEDFRDPAAVQVLISNLENKER